MSWKRARPITNRAITDLGRAAIDAINATNLSLEEVAAISGVGRSTIMAWARGVGRPRPYLAQCVIDAMEEQS